MAARGTGSSPGRDRGSGSALLAHAGWRSAAVLGLATLLLLAVAIGTRGSPGGAIPVPAAPAVWQTATYALVGIVIGITIAGLPIALVARRRQLIGFLVAETNRRERAPKVELPRFSRRYWAW